MDTYKVNGKSLIVARYWTGIQGCVCVVASVNSGIDWAAYIGGTGLHDDGSTAAKYVAEMGAKLNEKDAYYFFGELAEIKNCKLGYRR